MADDNLIQTQGDITISGINGGSPTGAGQGSSHGAGSAAGGQTQAQDQHSKAPASLDLEEAALAHSSQQQAAPVLIPDSIREKFPDLQELVETTESMNREEKDYWFQILPIMTDDQITRFRDILVNEKNQLQKIDQEYSQQLTKLNEKHMLEWKEFETKEKRDSIRRAEAEHRETETEKERELLERLATL
jgi:hypothetical protein